MTHDILTIEIKLDELPEKGIENESELRRQFAYELATQWSEMEGVESHVIKDAKCTPSQFIDWLCWQAATEIDMLHSARSNEPAVDYVDMFDVMYKWGLNPSKRVERYVYNKSEEGENVYDPDMKWLE